MQVAIHSCPTVFTAQKKQRKVKIFAGYHRAYNFFSLVQADLSSWDKNNVCNLIWMHYIIILYLHSHYKRELKYTCVGLPHTTYIFVHRASEKLCKSKRIRSDSPLCHIVSDHFRWTGSHILFFSLTTLPFFSRCLHTHTHTLSTTTVVL